MERQPASIGPYRIVQRLGQGGMGTVYRGVHRQTGETAAVKTVRVPHAALSQSLRREIHALAHLRHPGIVRIFEEGLEEGVPWYAMELLEGSTLEAYRRRLVGDPPRPAEVGTSQGWWSRAIETRTQIERVPRTGGPGPASPAAAHRDPGQRPAASAAEILPLLSVVRRLCTTLAYLHGEGIVHRDLKPDNVLLRNFEFSVLNFELELQQNERQTMQNPRSRIQNSPWPVLVDFGLMAQVSAEISREAFEVGGLMAGTAAYMAPEQLQGELVDARADLYSLGCILYELVTGQRPFEGSTWAELRQAHLTRRPQAPSHLAEWVPAQLDRLVLRLLEKRPQDRIGHAADVGTALGLLGAELGPVPAAPEPRAYLYRPGFAGRAEVLEPIRQALSTAMSGTGGLALLGGESGAGKTRLAMEVGREALRRGFLVLNGECPPLDGGAGARPLQAFRRSLQAIADRCRERGPLETERLLGRRGPLLALYEPALLALPGQPVEAQDVVPLPADASRLRLYRALAETLAAVAQTERVLLVLDDLQWADGLTLGALEHLLRSGQLGQMPLVVLGMYRLEECRPELQALGSGSGVASLRLLRLQDAEVEAMIGGMLALSPPPLLVQLLSQHSEGNPFFVAEYLRAALAEGLLSRDGAGRWQLAPTGETGGGLAAQLHLPRSIRDLVARRLDALSPAARSLAEAAAVLGRESWVSVLAAVSGTEGAELLEATQELLTRQFLEEAAGPKLRFAHDKLREVAYEGIVRERRPMLHRLAAQAQEVQLEPGRGDPGPRFPLLASVGQHWEQTGERQRARERYLEAAREAADLYALSEAEGLYRACLRLLEAPGLEMASLRNELGSKVLSLQGRGHEAIVEHTGALQMARQAGDRLTELYSLLELGLARTLIGQLGQSRTELEEALELARSMENPRGLAMASRYLGLLDRDQGRMLDARARFQAALTLFRELGERYLEALTLNSVALTHYDMGQLQEARSQFDHLLEVAREIGDRKLESTTQRNMGLVLQKLGDLDSAEAHYERAIALHREIGARRLEASTVANLALVYLDRGWFTKAQRLMEEVLQMNRETDDRRAQALVLTNLGIAQYELGHIEAAQRSFEQSLTLHREIDNRVGVGQALGNLGLTLHLQGQLEMSRSICLETLNLARESGDQVLESNSLVFIAQVERLSGSFEAAERFLNEAGSVLEVSDHLVNLVLYTCERGHLALARGNNGRSWLEKAHRLIARHGSASAMAKNLESLRCAVESFEAGGELLQGEYAERLPEGLRARLLADRDRNRGFLPEALTTLE